MCNQGGGYIDQWRMGSAGKTWFQGQTKCSSAEYLNLNYEQKIYSIQVFTECILKVFRSLRNFFIASVLQCIDL